MNRRAAALAVVALAFSPGVSLAAHFVHPTDGYAFDYPDSWHVDQAMLDVHGPLFLSNLYPAYRHGGLMRPHAITIEVLAYPDTVDEETALIPVRTHSHNVKRSVGGISPSGAVRVDYDFDFDALTTYPTTSIALRAGARLFILQMTYEQRTPNQEERKRGEAALSKIASSLSGS